MERPREFSESLFSARNSLNCFLLLTNFRQLVKNLLKVDVFSCFISASENFLSLLNKILACDLCRVLYSEIKPVFREFRFFDDLKVFKYRWK